MAETSKTAAHALRLLLELGEQDGSTADLVRRSGLHRTVVQRLLATLREQGFVARRPDGQLTLGPVIPDLAARMQSPVRAVAAAPMLVLSRRLNETVALTVRDGDDAVSAAQIGAVGHFVRAEYPPGHRHPLSLAAAGRAILSGADDKTLERFLRADPALGEQLEEIRRVGYAISADELGHGAAGIAAPVFDRSGVAIAAVGIITPMDRFPDEAEISGPVLATARTISDALAT